MYKLFLVGAGLVQFGHLEAHLGELLSAEFVEVCRATPVMLRITAFAWEILLTGWDSSTVLNACEYKGV